ncbi:MAG TPA: hypothetical protein VK506_16270 [Conexibacter sp.]|nr:hypothetical protein [Conexibacter sp.]
MTAAAFRLLADPRRPDDQLDPRRLAAELDRDGILDDETAFYTTMLSKLAEQSAHDRAVIDQLSTAFTAILWGILVMLCGLALAAIVG